MSLPLGVCLQPSPNAWLTSSSRSVVPRAGLYIDRSTSLVGYSLEEVSQEKITISIFAATLGAALLVSLPCCRCRA